jgi:thiol-disulfide isomerase/thioredoxin
VPAHAETGTAPETPTPTPTPRGRWKGLARDVLLGLAIFAAIQWWRSRDVLTGPLPSETVSLLDGTSVDLGGPRERPLLLQFEASWCGVCRAEDGTIRSLAEDHDVLVIASQSGDAAAVARFAEEHDLAHLRIAIDQDGSLAERFGVAAFPTTLFIDGDGAVSDVEVGYTTWLGMRARLAWAGL